MPVTCVGRIRDPCSEKYVTWDIPRYFTRSQIDLEIKSPVFHFLNASWCLKIYPNGQTKNATIGYMNFYLSREDTSDKRCCISCTLGIHCTGHSYAQKNTFFFDLSPDYDGWSRFIKREELKRNKYLYAPTGTLRVFCKVSICTSVVDSSSQTEVLDGFPTLGRDFNSLLHSEQKSDVTVKVRSRSFRVHKVVLAARSPVFAAMFEHNMKENSDGVVDIEDCEPNDFQDFLTFVYSGKIEKLSSDNATELYCLADKYDLSDLKVMCVDLIKEGLCLERACEVLTVADEHDESDLKRCAEDLIRKNLKRIIPTDQWIRFMTQKPTIAANLLMTVIPSDSS